MICDCLFLCDHYSYITEELRVQFVVTVLSIARLRGLHVQKSEDSLFQSAPGKALDVCNLYCSQLGEHLSLTFFLCAVLQHLVSTNVTPVHSHAVPRQSRA